MFWKIVGLTVSWIGAFVIVNAFGSRFNLVFVVPACLTLLFIYYRLVKEINFFEIKRGWVLVVSISCEIGIFIGTCLLLKFLSLPLFLEIIIGLVGITTIAVVGFCLIYFWWARRNLYFTFVSEGRAKIVVRGDAFHKIIMQWSGHKLSTQQQKDGEGAIVVDINDVIEGETLPIQTLFGRILRVFGGLKYYGFWPIEDIYLYDFEWVGMKQNGELSPHPKETLDYVLLKDDVYGALVEQAEDRDLLPLNVSLALTIKMVNPFKALFNVQSWYEMVINRITPYVRDFITTNTYKEFIQGETRIDKGAMERLTEEGILAEFKNRYGVELRKIEIKGIDPSKDLDNPIRKATIQKYLAAQEGAKRAGETIGALINMMSEATGKPIEEIRKEVAGSEELKKEFSVISQDLIRRKMAIDGNCFTHIKVDGAEGFEKMFLNLLSLWKKVPRSEKSSTDSTEEKKKRSSEE